MVYKYRGQNLGGNPDKKSQEFLPVLFTSTALRFIFLQTTTTSYVFLQTHRISNIFLQFSYCYCKGERRKIWYKTVSPSLGFKKSKQKLPIWEFSRLCPGTSANLYVHEFSFEPLLQDGFDRFNVQKFAGSQVLLYIELESACSRISQFDHIWTRNFRMLCSMQKQWASPFLKSKV